MSDTEKFSEARIEILGQVIYYPRTIWGTLSVVSVLVGVCIIVWIIAVKANNANIKTITNAFAIVRLTSEKIDPVAARYQIQFWTPSAKTMAANGVEEWEKNVTDERLNKFAADFLLKDRRVRGYRRYEVIGQGISARRDGMWWVMTVDDDYEITDLVKVYQEFWKNGNSIYVEVLRSSAGKYIK